MRARAYDPDEWGFREWEVKPREGERGHERREGGGRWQGKGRGGAREGEREGGGAEAARGGARGGEGSWADYGRVRRDPTGAVAPGGRSRASGSRRGGSERPGRRVSPGGSRRALHTEGGGARERDGRDGAGRGGAPPAPPTLPPYLYLPPPTLPSTPLCFECAILPVDKPAGMTSFAVVKRVRAAVARALGKPKAMQIKCGHAGTLDPLATGLLLLGVGGGTKHLTALAGEDKSYSGRAKLGESTPSLDADTEVTERLPWRHATDDDLRAAARALTGEIQQVPPMYSALKKGGQRLHVSARKGVEVEREPRGVRVFSFHLEREGGAGVHASADEGAPEGGGDPRGRGGRPEEAATDGIEEAAADDTDRPSQPTLSTEEGQLVSFRAHVSKGTYVRTLIVDAAARCGTLAHVVALRREASGEHSVAEAWELDQLLRAIEGMGAGGGSREKEGGEKRGAEGPGAEVGHE